MTRAGSVLLVFAPVAFVLAVDLAADRLVTDRGASVTTVMAACLPQTVVPCPFTTEAFWAAAILHALASTIADEISNCFENIFVAGIFVAGVFVAGVFVADMLVVPPGIESRGFVDQVSVG